MYQKKLFLNVVCCYFTQSAKGSVLFSDLISLPVLPNGPIRNVCVIISCVHCKEKTSYVLEFLGDG